MKKLLLVVPLVAGAVAFWRWAKQPIEAPLPSYNGLPAYSFANKSCEGQIDPGDIYKPGRVYMECDLSPEVTKAYVDGADQHVNNYVTPVPVTGSPIYASGDEAPVIENCYFTDGDESQPHPNPEVEAWLQVVAYWAQVPIEVVRSQAKVVGLPWA